MGREDRVWLSRVTRKVGVRGAQVRALLPLSHLRLAYTDCCLHQLESPVELGLLAFELCNFVLPLRYLVLQIPALAFESTRKQVCLDFGCIPALAKVTSLGVKVCARASGSALTRRCTVGVVL